MQQLERGGGLPHGRVGARVSESAIRAVRERTVRGDHERGPYPLAAARRVGDGGRQGARTVAERGRPGLQAIECGGDRVVDSGAVGGGERDHRIASGERAASNTCICSACRTSHGLNAQGVARSDTARSDGSTQRASTTSLGFRCGSSSTSAV